jgi:uncharacterized protein
VSAPIRTTFTVCAAVDRSWATLTDIGRIAHCVPGAELTEIFDDRTYKGKISVRLGPVSLAFTGQIQFEELDATAHRATIKATGSEAKGRGAAQGYVLCTLTPTGPDTRVDIATTLNLSGAIAQYGRATSMIAAVAQQLIDQFAAALEADMKAAAEPDADVAAPPAPRRDIPILRLIWRALTAMIAEWFRRPAR